MSTLPSSHVLEQKNMGSDVWESTHGYVQMGTFVITFGRWPDNWNTKPAFILSLVIKKEFKDSYHEYNFRCWALNVNTGQGTGDKSILTSPQALQLFLEQA